MIVNDDNKWSEEKAIRSSKYWGIFRGGIERWRLWWGYSDHAKSGLDEYRRIEHSRDYQRDLRRQNLADVFDRG